jgi:POT family proton-dependent oligopeptide transporter
MNLINKPPRGISIFFLTEMWERYGFYILQSLLVFYALDQLKLDDTKTYSLVGSFTALAYVNSIFGGLIADKLLGYNKTILLGIVFLCCGYSLLGLADNLNLVIHGLTIITLGTGLLKPNISSMLSILYQNHPRYKESGYTIFYIGIYFGALAGSFIGGFIKQYLGWIAVYASATIGLVIAYFIFTLGCKKFKLYDRRIKHISFNSWVITAFSLGILGLISFFSLADSKLSNLIFIIITLASIGFLVYNIWAHHGGTRKKLLAFGILTIFSVLYWAVYFQQFFSVSLAVARITHLTMPESSLSAFESLGIILFGPLVNYCQKRFAPYEKSLSIPSKFSLSFMFNGLSFLVLALGVYYAINHNILQNQLVIILSYFIIAIGELMIAPCGLAMVSSLVPNKLNGAMMGVFLMSIGLGGKLAGIFAQSAASSNHASLIELKYIYLNSFINYCEISLAVGIIGFISIKPIKWLIQKED